jgi:hypothetical protein
MDLLPQHTALIDIIGSDTLTLPEIVTRARKPAREELAGYYAPLAIQIHLDQLVAWGLLARDGDVYQQPD